MLRIKFSNNLNEVPKENLCIDKDSFSFAEKLWNQYKYLTDVDVEHVVGQCLIVDSFRVLVKRREIPVEDILFIFEGQEILANQDGGLEKWPRGFCDEETDLLRELNVRIVHDKF